MDSPKKTVKLPFKNTTLKMQRNRSDFVNNDQIKRKEELKTLYKNLITTLRPFHNFQDMTAPKKESVWVTP